MCLAADALASKGSLIEPPPARRRLESSPAARFKKANWIGSSPQGVGPSALFRAGGARRRLANKHVQTGEVITEGTPEGRPCGVQVLKGDPWARLPCLLR